MPGSSPGMTMWSWRSRLQLAFELVQEVPIRAVGDDLLRARLDHSGFMQAQRVEADRVLGVVLAPIIVWNVFQRLESVIIARGEAAIDEAPRDPRRLSGAEIGRLEDGAQHALGCDRVFADVVAVAQHHAAEMLRPGRSSAVLRITWPVLRARSSCGSGGNPRKASILPSTKSSSGLTDGSVTQRMSLSGSSPTWATIRLSNAAGAISKPTVLPFRLAIVLISFPANNSKQPTWTPASTVTGFPASIPGANNTGKSRTKSTLRCAIAAERSSVDVST